MFYQGFLKLFVWLYVDQSNGTMAFTRTDNGHAQEHMLEAVTEGEKVLLPASNVDNMFKLRSVGQVEISEEATLEDLKTQVKYKGCFFQLHQHLRRKNYADLLLFLSDVDAAGPSGCYALCCFFACLAA